MSVQFGKWNAEGELPTPDYIGKVMAALAPFGPDSRECYSNGGLAICYTSLYTTKEARHEKHPRISARGAVITWDGRLDNRSELIRELRDSALTAPTDEEIVAAAYDKWGVDCLRRLLGDWALSVCEPRNRRVILAKDFAGARHLYYSMNENDVLWCTILDPLLLFARKTFSICEEYVADWLMHLPPVHLTPYESIHSVPPSSYVLLNQGKNGLKRTVAKYWDFSPGKRIRYKRDEQYEEHFRDVLEAAVRRRLRSHKPILAELSGGMDSSSIVCMADRIIAGEADVHPRLDTISWYDDRKSCLNERAYIATIEKKRHRAGYHIDLGLLGNGAAPELFDFEIDNDQLSAVPSANDGLREFFRLYRVYASTDEYRAVLSGIGGDEATGGGIPTPIPELQNLLVRMRWFRFKRRLDIWAKRMGTAQFQLLRKSIVGLIPTLHSNSGANRLPAAWFNPDFIQRNSTSFSGCPGRLRILGPLPSFQEDMAKLENNRRFLSFRGLRAGLLLERRFPYLDRDLLEFSYAIPKEQLVGVGKRRYLMKRSLSGMIPAEILDRRQIGDSKPPGGAIPVEWTQWCQSMRQVLSRSVDIIDPCRLLRVMQTGWLSDEHCWQLLSRTLTLISWLSHLAKRGIVVGI